MRVAGILHVFVKELLHFVDARGVFGLIDQVVERIGIGFCVVEFVGNPVRVEGNALGEGGIGFGCGGHGFPAEAA